MRLAVWPALLALALAGCRSDFGPFTPGDNVVSLVSGLDCSMTHVAVGQAYCKPIEPPPAPPQYCTRSLAGVDCWEHPNPYGYYQRQVADGPSTLTSEQESNRAGFRKYLSVEKPGNQH